MKEEEKQYNKLELTKYQILQGDYDMNGALFLFTILFLKPVTKLFAVALVVRLVLVLICSTLWTLFQPFDQRYRLYSSLFDQGRSFSLLKLINPSGEF